MTRTRIVLRLLITLLIASPIGRVAAQVNPAPSLTGHWVSVNPERAEGGNFSVRDFVITVSWMKEETR